MSVAGTFEVRTVRMKLGDLFRDPKDGMLSVIKTLAMAGGIALLTGFLIQAKYRDLEWMDYIGFAVGMTVMSGAPIASSALSVMTPRLAGAAGKYAPGATVQPDNSGITATASVITTPAAEQPPKS